MACRWFSETLVKMLGSASLVRESGVDAGLPVMTASPAGR